MGQAGDPTAHDEDGLFAGRRGVLARPHEHQRLWSRLLLSAALVGVPGGLTSALLLTTADADLQQAIGLASGFGSAPALTAGYVALAAQHTRGRVLPVLAPAGRMSLTGYLRESILLSALFCGWDFGPFGELTAFPAALGALAVWAALERFSRA